MFYARVDPDLTSEICSEAIFDNVLLHFNETPKFIMFNRLPSTPLEIAESVDMLRVLEHGYKIRMVLTERSTCSVDTPEDLKHVDALMQTDPLFPKYA